MPQMSPMNWTLILLIIWMVVYTMNTLIYFNKQLSTNTKMTQPNNNLTMMKW